MSKKESADVQTDWRKTWKQIDKENIQANKKEMINMNKQTDRDRRKGCRPTKSEEKWDWERERKKLHRQRKRRRKTWANRQTEIPRRKANTQNKKWREMRLKNRKKERKKEDKDKTFVFRCVSNEKLHPAYLQKKNFFSSSSSNIASSKHPLRVHYVGCKRNVFIRKLKKNETWI